MHKVHRWVIPAIGIPSVHDPHTCRDYAACILYYVDPVPGVYPADSLIDGWNMYETIWHDKSESSSYLKGVISSQLGGSLLVPHIELLLLYIVTQYYALSTRGIVAKICCSLPA